MMVRELPGDSTLADLLERITDEEKIVGGDAVEGRPRVNHNEVEDIHQKLQMGDLVEMVPEKSFDYYREEFMRMYDDCSVEDLGKNISKPSRRRLSEVAVF
jgi:hypothetical protein